MQRIRRMIAGARADTDHGGPATGPNLHREIRELKRRKKDVVDAIIIFERILENKGAQSLSPAGKQDTRKSGTLIQMKAKARSRKSPG